MRKKPEQPRTQAPALIHGPSVHVELPVQDGWYASGHYVVQGGDLRLVEVRIFPGEGRPNALALPLPVETEFDRNAHAFSLFGSQREAADVEAERTGGEVIQWGHEPGHWAVRTEVPGTARPKGAERPPEPGTWSGRHSIVDELPSGAQINAGVMKRVPLRELREQAEWQAHIQGLVREHLFASPGFNPEAPGWKPFVEALNRFVEVRERPSDRDLVRLAQRYLELAESPETRNSPRKALAAEVFPKQPQADGGKRVRDLLSRARSSGLYKTAGQGSRGGWLTDKGREVLNRIEEES
jgi:hypothetical protein